jgi:hypothetical protein
MAIGIFVQLVVWRVRIKLSPAFSTKIPGQKRSHFCIFNKNPGTKKIALFFWYNLSLCYTGITPSQILTCDANLCAGLYILSHFLSDKKSTEKVAMMTSVLEVLNFLLFHSKVFWIRLGLDQGRGWTLCCYILSLHKKNTEKVLMRTFSVFFLCIDKM